VGAVSFPLLSPLQSGNRPNWLTPDVILILFLPALVFEGSVKLDLRELVRDCIPLLLLANAGVLLAAFATGYIAHWLIEPVVNAVQIEHAALLKAGIVAALVLAGFLAGFSPALVASVGPAVLLITRTRDPHLVYEEVDWGLLVFFVGLFLIVGGAENAGLTKHLFGFGERFNLQHLGVFTLVTAMLSNLVSNVPAVMLLKSLVSQFADTHSAWLTLAMATTLAGNLTITGSVANIIVVERAQKEAVITFLDYFRIGVPVTLLTLLVGWLWLSWIR
jgi:Na+/H+ antiporter NhaD/arsenite permease-like protein